MSIMCSRAGAGECWATHRIRPGVARCESPGNGSPSGSVSWGQLSLPDAIVRLRLYVRGTAPSEPVVTWSA